MKSFKDVEQNRRAYHQDAMRNSVHRSSLTVPELPGCSVDLSFLNHFKIKRGYDRVACRVTAVDAEGQRIASILHEIDERRAYTIPLTGMVQEEVETYLVDFFAADNLFIPFPASMVNHVGDGFINAVHSYNRMLNDPFEDDQVNANRVAEASIDVRVDDRIDTFAVFTAGPQRCVGELDVELTAGGVQHRASVALDVPRFGNELISLSQVFPQLNGVEGGVLRLRQPAQGMFYGRMLAGLRHSDGSFSANHSYYDNSSVEEYWDTGDGSSRVYPMLSGFDTIIRMYPIMSPGELAVSVEANATNGQVLGSIDLSALESPGEGYIDANVSRLLEQAGLDDAASITLRAEPLSGMTPTRVNHQLVYADRRALSPLASSINVSLLSPHMFTPEGKGSFIWGQMPSGPDWTSRLGIVCNKPEGEATEVEIDVFGSGGHLTSRKYTVGSLGAVEIDVADIVNGHAPNNDDGYEYLWYTARSSRPDLSAIAVTGHTRTGHTTGEHNF